MGDRTFSRQAKWFRILTTRSVPKSHALTLTLSQRERGQIT